jgi:hypothetical protein
MTVVKCPACGVDRWAGIGPCGTCGAFTDVAVENERLRSVVAEVRRLVWDSAHRDGPHSLAASVLAAAGSIPPETETST